MNEIYFEAYPRSGNTYFCDMLYTLFEKNNVDLKIYHHTHDISKLEVGLKDNLPCFTSIRNPLDACASFSVFSGKKGEFSLALYIEFYSFIESNLKDIKVFKFEDVVSDFKSVLDDINLKLKVDVDYFDVEGEVKALIKDRAKKRHGNNSHIRSGVPSEKRKAELATARQLLSSEPLLSDATSLYNKILSHI